MREILFRGKGTSGHHINKWTYGYYCKDFWKPRKGHGIFPTNPEEGGYVEIFHETLGQYTGLKDKNGRKIFEGDIVRYAIYPPDQFVHGVVNYKDGVFRIGDQGCALCVCAADGIEEYRLEGIGNIHDNPEMLKGENTNG